MGDPQKATLLTALVDYVLEHGLGRGVAVGVDVDRVVHALPGVDRQAVGHVAGDLEERPDGDRHLPEGERSSQARQRVDRPDDFVPPGGDRAECGNLNGGFTIGSADPGATGPFDVGQTEYFLSVGGFAPPAFARTTSRTAPSFRSSRTSVTTRNSSSGVVIPLFTLARPSSPSHRTRGMSRPRTPGPPRDRPRETFLSPRNDRMHAGTSSCPSRKVRCC